MVCSPSIIIHSRHTTTSAHFWVTIFRWRERDRKSSLKRHCNLVAATELVEWILPSALQEGLYSIPCFLSTKPEGRWNWRALLTQIGGFPVTRSNIGNGGKSLWQRVAFDRITKAQLTHWNMLEASPADYFCWFIKSTEATLTSLSVLISA